MNTAVETRAPVAERAFGREGLERREGFTPLPERREEKPEPITESSLRQRASEVANDRAKEQQEQPIHVHESGLDEKVTLTVDQAAKGLAEARHADRDQSEIDATKSAQREVDRIRSETTDARQPRHTASIETEADAVRAALKSKPIRDAIAERVTAADQQRTHYEARIVDAGKFAAASLFHDVPELANIPLQNWVSAIEAMRQREPARAQMAIARLQTLAKVEVAAQQLKQQDTARKQGEFKQYALRENQRFAEMTKGIPPREMRAIEAHVPAMLKEHGADVASFLKAVSNQSTFPRGVAEALLVKAARYDLMMKNAKAAAPVRQVPPVVRPGVASHSSAGERANQGLAQLSAKLSKSGSAKDAAKLLMARRAAARR